MNNCNIRTSSPERQNIIIINQKSPTHKMKQINEQYSLANNVFDPHKGSPPNDFMKNLLHRMSIYTKKEPTFNIE